MEEMAEKEAAHKFLRFNGKFHACLLAGSLKHSVSTECFVFYTDLYLASPNVLRASFYLHHIQQLQAPHKEAALPIACFQ